MGAGRGELGIYTLLDFKRKQKIDEKQEYVKH
jgi:hypothetical protein